MSNGGFVRGTQAALRRAGDAWIESFPGLVKEDRSRLEIKLFHSDGTWVAVTVHDPKSQGTMRALMERLADAYEGEKIEINVVIGEKKTGREGQ